MQTFEGGADARRAFYALAGIWGILPLLMAALFFSSPPATGLDRWAFIFGVCFMFALLAIIVRFIGLEAWSRYALSAEGVVKATPLGIQKARWGEISDFDVVATSPRHAKYRLRSQKGEILVVQPGYAGERAVEFEQALQSKLEPALLKKREAMLHEGIIRFPQRGINFYSYIGAGAGCAIASLSLLSPSDWVKERPIAFLSMTLIPAAASLIEARLLYLQEMRIGGGAIELRTPFSRTAIRLDEIASVTEAQGGYVVHSGGVQIFVNASMPDFHFIVEHISQYAQVPPLSPSTRM